MIEIQRADLDAHRETLIRLLQQHLTERSDEKRYDWFYKRCPHGQARVWIAVDTDSAEIVGSAAIVPQRMRIGGEHYAACVMADFWVHPNHRVLGPALRLQRACIDGAREAGMLLFTDLPQGSMPAVYRRLGVHPAHRLLRYVRPLRSAPYLSRLRLPTLFAKPIGYVADGLLSLLPPGVPSQDGLEFSEQAAAFGPDFTELADRVGGEYSICVARSAEYLEWRYTDHYYLQHHLVTARRGARLEAYAVFTIQSGIAQVVDVFGARDRRIIGGVIAAAIRFARRRGATAINLPALEGDPLATTAASMWFACRGASPVIVQALDDSVATQITSPYLTYGDLDY